LEGGYLNETQADMIRVQVRQLLVDLRPEAVGIVDSFDWSDFTLISALGKYDGNCYETLYEWAKKEPFNQGEVVPGYNQYIKPLMNVSKAKL